MSFVKPSVSGFLGFEKENMDQSINFERGFFRCV